MFTLSIIIISDSVLSRNTGVGDHGQEGIEAYIKQHKCQTMCNSLGLAFTGEDESEPEVNYGEEEGEASSDEGTRRHTRSANKRK